MNPRGQGVDDHLVNLGLLLIAALAAIAALLRLAGTLAAWLAGAATPPGGAVVALHETQAPPLQPGDGLGFGGVSLGTRVRACRAPASCCSAEKESHCRPSLLP